jgi:hypothetical protein
MITEKQLRGRPSCRRPIGGASCPRRTPECGQARWPHRCAGAARERPLARGHEALVALARATAREEAAHGGHLRAV